MQIWPLADLIFFLHKEVYSSKHKYSKYNKRSVLINVNVISICSIMIPPPFLYPSTHCHLWHIKNHNVGVCVLFLSLLFLWAVYIKVFYTLYVKIPQALSELTRVEQQKMLLCCFVSLLSFLE